MKVLLTGASGFVGSHVLDVLQARKFPTAILLRDSSNRRYFERHLAAVEIRSGSITEPGSLLAAMEGVTHVIHCAGCTRASVASDYRTINQEGTAHLVSAVNARSPHIQRLVHLSSLAASGPATPEAPARESAVPKPISEYGRTKLAGEIEVRGRCRAAYTILRPPAVYGPRDTAFLPIFKAVKNHVLPSPNKNQALSLVFVRDLAEAVVLSLQHPNACGKTYFVSSRDMVSGRKMAKLIAEGMNVWTVPLPVPLFLLWTICLIRELISRLTGKAGLLNLQKFAELRAPGWVCDPSRFEGELHFKCGTTLAAGVSESIKWYRQAKWL